MKDIKTWQECFDNSVPIWSLVEKYLKDQIDIDNALAQAKEEDEKDSSYEFESTTIVNIPYVGVYTFKFISEVYYAYFDADEEDGAWNASITVKMLDSKDNMLGIETVVVGEDSIKSLLTVALGIVIKQLMTKGEWNDKN